MAPKRWMVAALRAYFGLTQQEVAGWLGVSEVKVSHLEAGRRGINEATAEALAPLLRHLPPAGAAPAVLRLASATAPLLALSSPEAAPLLSRIDHCRHTVGRLRAQLRPLEAQATVASRWAAALPALRAALPPDPGLAAEPDPDTAWAAWLSWFRHRWLDLRRPVLPPDLSARYHLLRLQAEALEAEAAALASLLPPAA
ncbi:helix-turn-helix transcriptional regulator [Hymenobacter sp. BT175]|uniref:helix-turn-helix transcriptional regulator n=1 Tax=Hymenobacter translucens TaxID=2886507 RepID=UPI001D0DFC0E|nr:helix-turn-helix transcriptional regulator [Hymenobacter translucens]MCC2547077.1 helix-turn-helix transcriptional regulator [Hymenobacter translucens]